MHAVISLISGPYSTVRSAVRPAKFENLIKRSLASFFMSFLLHTLVKLLESCWQLFQKSREDLLVFQILTLWQLNLSVDFN